MARKTKVITIDNEKSRDNGKSYQITEMNVLDIDEWAIRVGCAMARGGLDVRDLNLQNGLSTDTITGILELMNLGIQGFGNMPPLEVVKLLNELVDRCVKFIPSGGKPRALDIENANDVEEFVSTLWKLRKEAFNLHVGFFRTRRVLEDRTDSLNLINQDAFLKPLNVSMYVFQALNTGLVSYVDLFKMSVEDVLNVIEIDQVKKQHEALIREYQEDGK